MDSQLIYTYKQRQELNDECDRVYSTIKAIKSYDLFNNKQKKDSEVVEQVILINGSLTMTNDPDFKSVLQVLKRFITKLNNKLITKLLDVKDEIKMSLNEIKRDQSNEMKELRSK